MEIIGITFLFQMEWSVTLAVPWNSPELCQRRQSDTEGTMPVNVVEDYTQRVREERKRLVPHMLELRRSQPTVKTYIKYDKLVSGRDTFTLDENNRLMKVGNGSR